jgi:DNA-binding MarR family transcriptional regulator
VAGKQPAKPKAASATAPIASQRKLAAPTERVATRASSPSAATGQAATPTNLIQQQRGAAKPPTAGFDPLAEARRQWDARWDAGDAMEAATSIMRAQQLVLAVVEEALVPFNLTFARYEALTLLSFSRRGSLPMGKMGQRLMIHAASVTNIVDRLEAQGLVKRTAHPDDRRTILCELTNDGRRIAEKAAAAVNTIEFGVGILSPAERTQLIRLVRKLRAANGDII